MAVTETWTDPDSLDRAAGDVLTEVIYDGVVSDLAYLGGQTATGVVASKRIGLPVDNSTGGTLTAGTLVYISGYDASTTAPQVTKADGDSHLAEYVLSADIANAAAGVVYRGYTLGSQNTSGSSVGDPIYLSATAGGWTGTALTGAAQLSQKVGVVVTSHASTGSVQFDLPGEMLKWGSGNLQSKSVAVAALADGTDGELITWSASAVAATVAVGTATHVLTSNGSGAAPTFQAAGGGGAVGAISKITSGDITTTSTSFASTGFTIADTLSASSVQVVTFSFSHFMNVTGGETWFDVFDGTNYASSGGTSAYTNGILEVSQGAASDGFPVSVQSVWTGLDAGATTFTLYWRIGNSGWQGGIEANTSGPVISASIIEMA